MFKWQERKLLILFGKAPSGRIFPSDRATKRNNSKICNSKTCLHMGIEVIILSE